MQVVVLAGGKGTRLKPYTTVIPKPLMPIGDYPILEVILRQLKRAGVEDVTLAVGHMAQMFQAFFGSGERLGLRIGYSFEDQPLGTAGPIGLLLDRLGDNFAVMNGDLLTTIDYARLFATHLASPAAATICSHIRETKIDFGVLEADATGRLKGYVEKPTHTFEVSMGINVFRKAAILPYVVPGQYLDIPDLIKRLVAAGQQVQCFRPNGFWLDIGRPEDYQLATEIFEERRAEFLPDV